MISKIILYLTVKIHKWIYNIFALFNKNVINIILLFCEIITYVIIIWYHETGSLETVSNF